MVDASWTEGLRILQAVAPGNESEFQFDLLDQVHYVFNGLNRHSFPKKGLFKSPHVLWTRAGMGVFDFLLSDSATQKPQEGETVLMKKITKAITLTLTCVVIESHMQTMTEIGEFYPGERKMYSSVCGRARLVLKALVITTN